MEAYFKSMSEKVMLYSRRKTEKTAKICNEFVTVTMHFMGTERDHEDRTKEKKRRKTVKKNLITLRERLRSWCPSRTSNPLFPGFGRER